MRVGMRVIGAGRQQRARLAQITTDRAFGRVERFVDDAAAAFLALCIQIIRAQPQPVIAVPAIGHDGENGLDPVRLAQFEIILAMVGCHMDNAGPAIGSDEITGQHRARLGIEPAKMVHWVAAEGAG